MEEETQEAGNEGEGEGEVEVVVLEGVEAVTQGEEATEDENQTEVMEVVAKMIRVEEQQARRTSDRMVLQNFHGSVPVGSLKQVKMAGLVD